MTTLKKFPCLKCGSCCKMVGFVVEGARELIAGDVTEETKDLKKHIKEVADFPIEFNLKTGHCSWLTKENTCSDYKNRPAICKTSTTFSRHYRKNHTQEEYFNSSKIICSELRRIVFEKENEIE